MPVLYGELRHIAAALMARERRALALQQALERVIALYEAWDRPREAARYRAALAPVSS